MIYDKLCDGLNVSYTTSIFKFEIARFCHFKFVLSVISVLWDLVLFKTER